MKNILTLLFTTLILFQTFAQEKNKNVQISQFEKDVFMEKLKPFLNDEVQSFENKTPFSVVKNEYLEMLWKLNPGWATYLGNYEYNHLLEIPDANNRIEKVKIYQNFIAKLEHYRTEKLSVADVTDKNLMENNLKSSIWYLTKFKSFEWDPSEYNIAGLFDIIANEKDIRLQKRLEDLNEKLKLVPKYYEVAQNNLKIATKIHTELAIKQSKGGLYVFEDLLPEKLNEAKVDLKFKSEFENNLLKAKKALQNYIRFLELDFIKNKNNVSKSFRIGSKLYAEKFKFDMETKNSAEEIYKKAIAEKQIVLEKMGEITDNIWKKHLNSKKPKDNLKAINILIEKLSENHTTKDNFINAIKAQLPTLVKFVKEKNIAFLDDEKSLIVRETPKYMQGVAGASISSPGVYDKNGETFYNVTPLDNYNVEEAESYLREYNNYMLQILNIHEAIPGHYTQLVYANNSPSIIKSILGNGTMIEGWACYAERMMLEEGYGNNEPELWLMYYKWLLRIISNTILDYSLHNLNMSEADALKLLVDEAFQESTEAIEKIERAKLSQVQLCSYYAGLSEIYDFRKIYMDKTQCSLREFHDKFLSYGSIAVKDIARMMMMEINN